MTYGRISVDYACEARSVRAVFGRSRVISEEKRVETIRCDICGRSVDQNEATQLDNNAIHWGCPNCVPPGTMLMPCTRCRRFLNLPADNWDGFLDGPICEDCAEEEE